MEITYKIWLLCYDEDYNVNDFEKFVKSFTSLSEAKVYFDVLVAKKDKYFKQYKNVTPHCQLVLEETEVCECIDRIMKEDLW